MKVLFLVPYPLNCAPSQRFRFEQYFRYLDERGIQYKVQSFLNKKAWNVLYQKGNDWSKFWGVVLGFLRRDWQMLNLIGFDLVFIHREAAPIGPPLYEWWIAQVLGKKIIYDFDDAIWLPNTSEQNQQAAGIKWHHKVSNICKWAWKVSAGNEYLAEYASKYNQNVIVIPTTIDMEYHKDKEMPASPVGRTEPHLRDASAGKQVGDGVLTIGWTGSHSTMPYLQQIEKVIDGLSEKYNFKFLVISNKEPNKQSAVGSWQLWRKETEIEDLYQIDIGIMPMPDNEWAKGKCGFKALQFMALGKPVVASAVGVNTEIIRDGENGFLASTEDEWVEKLSRLVEDPSLRERLGKAGRKTVIERYSVEANKEKFLALFDFYHKDTKDFTKDTKLKTKVNAEFPRKNT